MAAAYRHYDHPAGARFKVSKVRPLLPNAITPSRLAQDSSASPQHPGGKGGGSPLAPAGRAGTRRRCWNAPEPGCSSPRREGVKRRRSRWETPPRASAAGHPLPRRTCFGVTTSTWPGPAWASPRSCTTSSPTSCKEKAEGRDADAIVVIDPHTDLVERAASPRPAHPSQTDVRLIDLADERGGPWHQPAGHPRLLGQGPDRRLGGAGWPSGLWDQWGPRMQSILEQTVKTLHEANEHPSTSDDEQYTILDGLKLLSDNDYKQHGAGRRSPTPSCWSGGPGTSGSGAASTRADALAPVQTRLSYYASSKTGAGRTRPVPGSTIDMRQVILDGGVLLVSTSQGTAGRDVADPGGRQSLLNLVDAVIREQGGTSPLSGAGAFWWWWTRCSRCPAWTMRGCSASWASSARHSSWQLRASPS